VRRPMGRAEVRVGEQPLMVESFFRTVRVYICQVYSVNGSDAVIQLAEQQLIGYGLPSTFPSGSQIDGIFALTFTLVGSCSSTDSLSSLSQLHSESQFVGSRSL